MLSRAGFPGFVGMPAAVAGGPAYDADADALFARMAVQPSDAEKGYYNTLILALKAAGTWDLRQSYVSLWSHTTQAALLNLKGTSFTPAVAGGAPSFTANQGYTFDGVDDSLSTAWAGADAPQDAVSIDFWFHDTAAFVGNVCGNGSNIRFNPRTTGGSDFMTGRLNNGGSSTATVATAAGLSGMQRTGAGTIQYWRDGAQVGTDVANTSNAVSASALLIGANGAAFQASRCGFYALGGVLTAPQRAAEFAAIDAYRAARGA
ncbi:MAG: hypothetical protein V4696_07495 [Pseudomonadota bacterium]